MDDRWFDRWTLSLTERLSRRGLGRLDAGVLTSLGLNAVTSPESVGSVAAATTSNAPGQQTDKKSKPDARDRRVRKAPRNRGRNRNQPHAHVEPTRQELREQSGEQCDGPGMILLPNSGLCTHGPDPAPPGVDPTQRARPLPPATARVAAEALTCDGDGQSGPRVQVLYAHAANRPNRYTEYLASFRAWAAETDAVMQESAAAGGGDRRFRFVTTPGCQFDVQQVTLSPTGDDAFDNTIVELEAQGFTGADRFYLVFVDTAAAGICGIATGSDDDSPGQANWNNYGPSYSRVDAGCWNAFTAAHELMHNLGAVNDSAPNTSRGGHCIDDYDIMCYTDKPFFPAMRNR